MENKELLQKAKEAKSAEELMTIAKENGVERITLMKDIDLWRQKFGRNPEVLRLSGELLKG